ncbi:LuxR family transcriptional regulator [Nocardioides mangrovicus]|uniref:LuxR family transcriptional regulator n=1 Tax=Nocardioides mangrovicus TaxID=2478913 RepID=A0A3L8NY76_9ACTN|nr:LuxR family transcriptional regulator [Nocardioides mangrovicus]RLV48166.1 LuxR family transcriptional regulator [Nocardioides mangrovicus]
MTEEFGPADRALLENEAAALYEDAVRAGSVAPDDPRLARRAPTRPAFDLLVDLGLLTLDPEEKAYLPVDPSAVQSRVVAPMGQRAVALLEESGHWSELFGGLGQTYRRSAGARHPVTHIRGLANINRFLSTAVEDAREELLTAQPTRGRSSTSLEKASERDLRAVQRGVVMRTLYQHSARRSLAIKEYVEMTAPFGAQVRTLEEFFNRMIVIDRAVAIVPGVEGNNLAIAIHEASLVAYLADVFERYWERARPYDDHAAATTRIIAEDVRNMTVRMLVEGHSDPASAKRIGISTRTYAGYIAALKDEYGVQTRFQLGHAMGLHEAGQDDA